MSEKPVEEVLWSYMESHRNTGSVSSIARKWLDEQLELENGGLLTPDALYYLSERLLDSPEGMWITPRPLARFIASLASLFQPKSVLDPMCGTGLLLESVGRTTDAPVLHGVEINEHLVRISRTILGSSAHVTHGDLFAVQEQLQSKYDLIVVDPPIGNRLSENQVISTLGADFRGSIDHALTVWACERLSPGGVAIVLVNPSFLYESRKHPVFAALGELGCRLRACLHLPGGSLSTTRIETYLAVLEHGEQGEVFVGQFKDEPTHTKNLLANFRKGKRGPTPALGRYTTIDNFKGFDAFVAQERVNRLGKKSRWPAVPASQVILRSERVQKLDDTAGQQSNDNCYLSLTGRRQACLVPEDLPARRDVARLQVNPELVEPAFLVHWFNDSKLGRDTLDAVSSGTTVQRVNLDDLLKCQLHLPSLDEQRSAIGASSKLKSIRSAVDELETALWDCEVDLNTVSECIATINQDGYRDWIETLPFPMASILWRHDAGVGSYETLLHFFEATAAFLATIHLSAIMQSASLWNEHGQKLVDLLIKQHLSIDRATFGAWRLTYEVLSSAMGKLRNSVEDQGFLSQLFSTDNERVHRMLTDSRLRSVLQRANSMRNDWSAHAGPIGEEQARQLESELTESISVLREVFGRSWLKYELIQPGPSRYRNGVHHCQVKRLMGTRANPFEEIEIESLDPLEDGSLYLFDRVNRTGLELCPFVRVIPSPEKQATACFIFNRKDGERSRFVSYHFEQESSIDDTVPGVDEILQRFHLFEKGS